MSRPESYAVVWRKGQGPVVPGRLQLGKCSVQLRGGLRSSPQAHDLRYADISAVRLSRSSEERVHGRPSLLLELVSLDCFFVAAVGSVGVVAELADLIAVARTLA